MSGGFGSNAVDDCVIIGSGAAAGVLTAGASGATLIGKGAGAAVTGGGNNTAIGFNALNAEDGNSQNTAIGYQALLVQNGADSNTVIGNQAGKAISTGGDNTLVGTNSGLSLQSGAQNVAIGAFAFDAANSDESHNVAIGCAAMGAADGTDVENCVVIGHSALSAAATHATEIAIGEDAMLSWTGAGTGGGSATAGYNIAIGGNALDANVSGARNIAIGFDALGIMNANNNSQTQNVAIGHDAGNTIGTGTDNVCIGYAADTGAADSVNQIAIGSGVTGIDVDNSVTLGNADVTEVYCASDKGARVYGSGATLGEGTFAGSAETLRLRPISDSGANDYIIFSEVGGTGESIHVRYANDNGVVGTIKTNGSATSFNTSSDYRLKENEVLISDGLTRLNKLKPYRFNFKADDSKTVDGFFAHEVSDIVPEAVTGAKDAVDSDGNIESQGIDQSKLVPILVKAVQELSQQVEDLKAKVGE